MFSLKFSIKEKSDFNVTEELVLFKILFKAKGNLHTKEQQALRLAEMDEKR